MKEKRQKSHPSKNLQEVVATTEKLEPAFDSIEWRGSQTQPRAHLRDHNGKIKRLDHTRLIKAKNVIIRQNKGFLTGDKRFTGHRVVEVIFEQGTDRVVSITESF